MGDGARQALNSEPWSEWVKRKESVRGRTGANSVKAIDLFSGCGGMTLGLVEGAARLGTQCELKLAVDLNDAALQVYRSNFGVGSEVARCQDAAELIDGKLMAKLTRRERDAMALAGNIDVVVAGPPCQGHSDLNNHSRRDDPRNGLYLRVVRAVEVFQPRFVLVENVAPVVHDVSGVVSVAEEVLRRRGYAVFQGVVAMTAFGVPQRRKRHVTIAALDSSDESLRRLATGTAGVATVREFIEDIELEAESSVDPFRRSSRVSQVNATRIDWLFEHDQFDLPDSLRPPCHRDKPHSYRSMYGRMSWDAPCQTITTGFGSMGQGRFVHPSRRRMITCHEAARLQGFPDFFDFSSGGAVTAMREMIGNAVPPPFVAELMSGLLRER